MMNEFFFSAPGRIEIGGNHTDHQRGRVLAAAINREIRCKAEKDGTDIVSVNSDGFGEIVVDLSDLQPRDIEKGTASSLIRGIAAWLKTNGFHFGGFSGNIWSDIPSGIGLSSSAAFEVLICRVFNGLFNNNMTPLEVALASRYAENTYFGKPSGLMDQAASSYGSINVFDFENEEKPAVSSIVMPKDLENFAKCVVSTGESHESLTPEYAAITNEMKLIARYFGKEFLREVSSDMFYSSIRDLRQFGDRAVIRALHFFEENDRVAHMAAALDSEKVSEFMSLVKQSGLSSLAYLQNIYSVSAFERQGLSLALALCEKALGDYGAFRVHGGGFAGSILAFVPRELTSRFERIMTNVFGDSCCHFLEIQS